MIIFVTGSTSGFGEAIAVKFAQNGWDVILNGRRQARLQLISDRLESEFKVKTFCLPFDVRHKEEVVAAIAALPKEWRKIDLLVNNAGLALGLSTIQEGNTDDWDTMIDTNIRGLLYVTREVSPLLIARKTGHIINIGSTAGKEVYPNGNVYCATKHAVDALNKAMRMDMLPYNIRVTAIDPGLAETEFSLVRFKGDQPRATKVYEGFTPLFAADIADVAYYAATRPAHVCLNDIVVTCTAQATSRDVVRR